MTSSSLHVFLWILAEMYTFTLIVWVYFRVLQHFYHEAPLLKRIHLSYMGVLYTVALVMHVTLILKRNQALHFFQRLIKFCILIQRQYVLSGTPVTLTGRISEFLLPVASLLLLAPMLMVAIPAFLFPHSPDYLISILWEFDLQPEGLMLIFVRFANTCSLLIALGHVWAIVSVFLSAGIIMILIVDPLMDQLHQAELEDTFEVTLTQARFGYLKRRNFVTKESIRHSWTKLGIYEQMALIVNEGLNIFSLTLAGMQLNIMVVFVFGLYSLVRLGSIVGVMAGGIGFIGLFIMVLLFSYLANIAQKSQTILEEWKSTGLCESNAWRKKLKSLTPIKIPIGGFYNIEKISVATMCKIVIDAAANALILTQ